MKRRLIIIIGVLALIIISIPFVIMYLDYDAMIIYAVCTTILLVYTGIYVFSGLSKFIIYLIYGMIVGLPLLAFKAYQHPIIGIGTLMILINPLSNFESYLEENLSDQDTLPLRITIRGKYWPFFNYRKQMEEQYYLPQVRKLFTKKWYLRLRQGLMLVLLFAAIYLFINELRNIVFSLTEYDIKNIFRFYSVASLFAMSFVLFKKGFTALLKATVTLMFVPIIFIIIDSEYRLLIKVIASSSVLGIAVVYWSTEKINALKRVFYTSYDYYDVDENWYAYANALYEPLVYNEVYSLVSVYKIPISSSKFDTQFNAILYYANRRHFIITAYATNDDAVYLYAEFYHKHGKRTKYFQNYLKNLFAVDIQMEARYDKAKQIYEQKFFHKPAYVVARTLSLAELLVDLKVDSEIIISMVFSFTNIEDLKAMSQHYYVSRMEDLDDDNYYAARVSSKSLNKKYMIESKVRDMLLTGLLNHGQYVRVLVYY